MTWSVDAARELIARCSELRAAQRIEAVLRAEFQSRLRTVFPAATDQSWVNNYSEGAEAHTRVGTAAGTANRFIDTLIRSTVIEYEADLRQGAVRDHGLQQVREYVSGSLRTGIPISRIRGVLSDTVDWYVYDAELRPGANVGTCLPDDIILREVDSFVPTAADAANGQRFAAFLKRHLAREQSRPLTARHIADDLGVEGQSFRRHRDELNRLVVEGRKNDKSIELATDLWSRFVDHLELSPGAFRSQMYVDEVYVAVVARLLAANVLEHRAILSDDAELAAILSGKFFVDRFRLKNMVEDDYFGWISRPPFATQIVAIAREIQLDLYAYDFTTSSEPDLFGQLMPQLARRSQRKLLGQAWTPTWLARQLASRCLDGVPQEEFPRIVDMCCGSGAILAEVIAEGLHRHPEASLGDAVGLATGFDIDPLAVILAKTTWVVAMAQRIGDANVDVIVPIYNADSLFAVTPVSGDLPQPGEVRDFVVELDGRQVHLPAELIGPDSVGLFDGIVDWAYDEARTAVAGGGVPPSRDRAATLVSALVRERQMRLDAKLESRIVDATTTLALRMRELALANRNGIWAFILRNAYRPALLAGQFNGLVSNPPWLAMSQLADNPYKTQLSARAALYGLRPAGASHLHLELATTYLIHAVDRYLGTGASVACLLPGTIFNGHHHQAMRDAAYLTGPRPINFQISEVWEIAPATFKVRSAAVIGSKTPDAPPQRRGFYAQRGEVSEVSFETRTLGERTAWVLAGNAAPLGAPTTDEVPPQGADLMPRTAVCIDVIDRSGTEWRVATPTVGSPSFFSIKDAKKLKDRAATGFVAPRFIFRMLQSLNLLPFICTEPLAPIAIPATRSAAGVWEITDPGTIRTQGLRHTATWFEEAAQAVAAGGVVRPLAEKIDERHKLTGQVFPPDSYIVINPAGGGISCGACVPANALVDVVIDQTLYWTVVSTAEEAWYRVGILNSAAITEAIRPFNPQGEFGARHLHTLPNRVTPIFDPGNADHMEVARLAQLLSEIVATEIANDPAMANLERSIASRRGRVRRAIENSREARELERLCAAVLGTTPPDEAVVL